MESGTGVSIGSVLAFWCREGYQLVGSDKIYCNVRNGKAQWSNYLPVCEGKWVLRGFICFTAIAIGLVLILREILSPPPQRSQDPRTAACGWLCWLRW